MSRIARDTARCPANMRPPGSIQYTDRVKAPGSNPYDVAAGASLLATTRPVRRRGAAHVALRVQNLQSLSYTSNALSCPMFGA
jgi:hypothetical protein